MFVPTQKELDEAAELGVKSEGLNGIELREAIKRAKLRHQQANQPASGGGLNQYKALAEVARKLGLAVAKGTTMTELRHEVELQIGELLYNNGIEPGVMIVYGEGAGDYAGKRALVVKTDVTWTMNMPHIILKPEEADRAHTYYAHRVALHATVVK